MARSRTTVETPALGPRNTLTALTHSLMTTPCVTSTPEGVEALDIDRPLEQIAQTVLNRLNDLVGAGLVEQREDGSYVWTDAGRLELGS